MAKPSIASKTPVNSSGLPRLGLGLGWRPEIALAIERRGGLGVLVENVKIAMDLLPVPLALENIAMLFDWPDAELDEIAFITAALERTGALLLLDLSNLHANARNLSWDAASFLDALPLERLAYVHVGGGIERDGVYHDTHAHPAPPAALELLEKLRARVDPPGVLLERDDNFP